uniref:LOB domain-containing protein 41 n=1 Tax=Erigeron canadensis TaxID=72917 RepID=UPI001CB956EE|nr:LOB domain-containing protein 41 [Erigeron canadensis]
MRMSCNGCRVLRKGCSENCSIRPCLQWINSAESQANATVFLAKFYGRAGLMNLINAGPPHLRPAIFRSLLYEACGRIVNPIYGSVGLLWSGSWLLCQNAVEAVLNGAPITQITSDTAETNNGPPFKAYDIRHISKETNNNSSCSTDHLHRVVKTRGRFKRSGTKPNRVCFVGSSEEDESGVHQNEENMNNNINNNNDLSSHDESALSHQSEAAAGELMEESLGSAETSFFKKPSEEEEAEAEVAGNKIELELRLGNEPLVDRGGKVKEVVLAADHPDDAGADVDLRLDYVV